MSNKTLQSSFLISISINPDLVLGLDVLVNKGQLIVDEVDLIFNVMASHKFSLDRPTHLNTDTVDISLALYRFLLSSQSFKEKLQHNLFGQDSGAAFSLQLWHGTTDHPGLKHKIVSDLLHDNPFIPSSTTEATPFSTWEEIKRANTHGSGHIESYLLGARPLKEPTLSKQAKNFSCGSYGTA